MIRRLHSSDDRIDPVTNSNIHDQAGDAVIGLIVCVGTLPPDCVPHIELYGKFTLYCVISVTRACYLSVDLLTWWFMCRDRPFAQIPASPSAFPTHARAGSLSTGTAHYHRLVKSYGMCNLTDGVRIAVVQECLFCLY
jgi:hypothetical protein